MSDGDFPAVHAQPCPPVCGCDIFCAVVDNLGDAGVCWRLARQLAVEFGWRVRLFIDDPTLLHRLAPAQEVVAVCAWADDFAAVEAAEVVIEAFACTLPERYIEAMRTRRSPSLWINLEYLSAEDWIVGCHGQPSPQRGLRKYFFFPGFTPGSGGLLREREVAVSPAPTFSDGALEISLFCYAHPRLPSLLDAWRDGTQAVVCHVCHGLPQQQVDAWLGAPLPSGASVDCGRLRLHALPLLPQTDYDALLARCHLNFVRGEDSFVRAQWAERPFVWQIYPQTEAAHLIKLDAFLARYLEKVGADATAVLHFWQAWNAADATHPPLDWPAFAARLPALAIHAAAWARQIAAQGDLATNLVKFCAARL